MRCDWRRGSAAPPYLSSPEPVSRSTQLNDAATVPLSVRWYGITAQCASEKPQLEPSTPNPEPMGERSQHGPAKDSSAVRHGWALPCPLPKRSTCQLPGKRSSLLPSIPAGCESEPNEGDKSTQTFAAEQGGKVSQISIARVVDHLHDATLVCMFRRTDAFRNPLFHARSSATARPLGVTQQSASQGREPMHRAERAQTWPAAKS
jgi:hypothetical protein